jgi:hypothetical protein
VNLLKRVLRPEHRDTLTSMSTFARMQAVQYEEAEEQRLNIMVPCLS